MIQDSDFAMKPRSPLISGFAQKTEITPGPAVPWLLLRESRTTHPPLWRVVQLENDFSPALRMVAIEECPAWVTPAAERSPAARNGVRAKRMLWWVAVDCQHHRRPLLQLPPSLVSS